MKNLYYLRRNLKHNPELMRKVTSALNISKQDLSRKLLHPKKFTLGEVVVLKRIFRLSASETVLIFAPALAYNNPD